MMEQYISLVGGVAWGWELGGIPWSQKSAALLVLSSSAFFSLGLFKTSKIFSWANNAIFFPFPLLTALQFAPLPGVSAGEVNVI